MIRTLLGILCCVPLFLGLVSFAHAGDLKKIRLNHDGHDRRYLMYEPTGHAGFANARPMVLVLHGGGGTDRGMVRLTRSRWHDLADRHGFFVVYPNAIGKIWDLGGDIISKRLDVRIDDLGFLNRVIGHVAGAYPVDRSRVFATGISRGGQASFLLACQLPDALRAIAPVAMSLPEFLEPHCKSAPPTGMILINGTADPLVPYDGGHIQVFRRKRGRVLSTDDTVRLWLDRNGCDGPGAISDIDRAGDATSIRRTDWTGCNGAPVSLLRVENGGHTWPGGRPYLGRRLVGEVSDDVNATDEIWRFFSRF